MPDTHYSDLLLSAQSKFGFGASILVRFPIWNTRIASRTLSCFLAKGAYVLCFFEGLSFVSLIVFHIASCTLFLPYSVNMRLSYVPVELSHWVLCQASVKRTMLRF